MPTLQIHDQRVLVDPGETALDALLRAGVPVAHACRAGACHSCLLRASAGVLPAAAQVGLKDAQRAQGYFLACMCRPESDLTLADEDTTTATELVAVTRLAPDIVRVQLRPTAPFAYRPGQFVTLLRDDGLARSYSLASVPELGEDLELHVRVLPRGRMSGWLADAARPGDPLRLRGPSGDCIYMPGDPTRPLALIGTGTGLAPLHGVVRDALRRGHTGPVTLIHGAVAPSGLYLQPALAALARAHPNLRYVRCALHGEPAPDLEIGPIEAVAARLLPQLRGHTVFLCGDPERVRVLRKQSFLRGAKLPDILGDAFVTAPPPTA